MNNGNPIPGAASRQSARKVLESTLARRENEKRAVEILIGVIPWDTLSEDDEAVLWQYFITRPLP
jgi:hypothetical protein